MFARMRSRIEAAIPLPRIFILRVADSDCDRTGLDIAVIDVPAFLAVDRRRVRAGMRGIEAQLAAQSNWLVYGTNV
jgi:hypothetical protein